MEPVCLIAQFITIIKVIEVIILSQFQNLVLRAIVEVKELLADFMVSAPSFDCSAIKDSQHLLWQLFNSYYLHQVNLPIHHTISQISIVIF